MSRRETMGTAKYGAHPHARDGVNRRESKDGKGKRVHQPTEKQCRVLADKGLPIPKTRAKATSLIGDLAANNWKVTPAIKKRADKHRRKKRNRKSGKTVWQRAREKGQVAAGRAD